MRSYFRSILILFLIVINFKIAFSQNYNPKREFRGVWVATLANIDFPSRKGLSRKAFEDEWRELVTFYKENRFNALVVQSRPVADAFYDSKLAPWSEYLSGAQGHFFEPDFDPLAFMIAEAHKQGLEFHAWLNPYRATTTLDKSRLSDKHPFKKNPDWGLKYGTRWYFNPALPEVRNYITEIVEEILIHYDVDGIHFDDYFYPYKIAGEPLSDSLDFRKYGFGFYNIEDWRRHNVDVLIRQISDKIKAVSPHVKFGISPFGVWRNKSRDPVNGSETRAGQTCFDDLYADVLLWLERGWIDYVTPQLYWHIGFPPADFEVLADWWAEHSFDRHLYIGHGAYKIGRGSYEAWESANEIPNQIVMTRQLENALGSVFFSSKVIRRNALGFTDSLSNKYFSTLALLPEMPFLELEETTPPQLEKVKYRKGKLKLNWARKEKKESGVYCVVYRFEDSKPGDYDNPENILAITGFSNDINWQLADDSYEKGKTYTYVVSTVNRAHKESDLSNYRTVEIKKRGIKKIR